MKKIEVLQWGVQHIAKNHRNVKCDTDYEEYRSMSILDTAVPTLSDARMLCEDLGIDSTDCYCDHSWGVIVIDLDYWLDEHAQEEYVPTGREMWHIYGVEIGSPIENEPKVILTAAGKPMDSAAAVPDNSAMAEESIYDILPF